MALIITILLLSTVMTQIAAGADPFPSGYSMGNLGTILRGDSPAGRQPWNSASFYRDSLRFGLASSVTSYYDRMDNFGEYPTYRCNVGGWLSHKNMTFKASFGFFDALRLYREYSIYKSLGYSTAWLNSSIDLIHFRAGVVTDPQTRSQTGCGLTVNVLSSKASFFFSAYPVVSYTSDSFSVNHFNMRTGIYTNKNRYGSQGVILEITPDAQKPLRVFIGEEYRFTPQVGFSFAVAGNPTLVSFGIIIEPGSMSSSVSLVNHTHLGWSRGVFLEYFR